MIPWIELHTISVFGLQVQVWGTLAVIGLLAAWLYLRRQSEISAFIKKPEVGDVIFWALVFGLIGARLVHVLFYDIETYIARPLQILFIWEGGLSSFGGILGGAFGAWYVAKKKKVAARVVQMNLLVTATLISWIFGRIGCFLIHDHKGIICDTACPLHVLATKPPEGKPFLDMAFLELLFLVPIVGLILWKKWWKHSNFAVYVMGGYGLLRIALDTLRERDSALADARFLGLTPGQYFGMLFVAVALTLLHKRKGGRVV